MTTTQLVLVGILGGGLAELGSWYALRKDLHQGLPDWSKNPLYWLLTALMVLAGGVLVWLHALAGGSLNPFLALNIGVSAPLILQGLTRQAPQLGPGSSD